MNWLKQNRTWLFLVVIAAIVALTAAVTRKSEIPVRAEMVKKEDIVNTITTNGKVEPVNNFQAHAIGAGVVRKVLVKEGDRVHAGQMLVQLDDADARSQAARAQAQIKAAEADLHAVRKGGSNQEVLTTESNLVKAKTELDSAQRNLTAMQRLKETGSASAGEVEEAQNRIRRAQAEYDLAQKTQTGRYSNPEVERVSAQLAEAKAAYAAAQEQLRNANIASPFAGTAYSLPVREGAFLSPGDLIVQVADLHNMQVRAFVDEPDIAKLSKGQKAALTWDALPGQNWEGMVTSVPSTVTARGSRNVGEVVVAVQNADRKLLQNI